MPNLQLDTGEIVLDINRDGTVQGQLKFNPQDVLFAEKFYHLMSDFKMKLDEYEKRAKPLEDDAELDEYKVPVNMQERFDLLKDICGYIRSQIDAVFGDGTSQIVFGDILNLDAFYQFFDGITPYLKKAREEKTKPYISPVRKPKGSRRK